MWSIGGKRRATTVSSLFQVSMEAVCPFHRELCSLCDAIFTWAAGRDSLPGLQCRWSFSGQLLCLVIWCPGSIAINSFIWVCAGLYWEHMDVSPECLCRAVRWGSWSQCFGVISLERGLGKGKGTTCSCVMKRAQVGSCPLDLSFVQVSGFNPSYWMALGSSSWVLYFCSWKQSSEASGTLCGLSTGSYTEARISNEINGNPRFGLGQQFIRKQKRVVQNCLQFLKCHCHLLSAAKKSVLSGK